VDDRHDMVVKALSWALRAAAPWDAAAVDGFLARHPVAPRVRREVRRVLDAAAHGTSTDPVRVL
jgi:3-methyladenine DNA glycosylase AlkD